MKEFFYDEEYLIKKYKMISKGLEGSIYKISSDKIVKKYHNPVNKNVLEVDKIIKELKLKKFRYSLSNLVYDNLLYASLYKFFDGKIIGNNIKDINIDFLIQNVAEIIKEISILSSNNIIINDFGKKDILYNKDSMLIIDTNSYEINNYLKQDILYRHNLQEFLIYSSVFNINELYEFKDNNKSIKELMFDLDNYVYLLIELKKELENLADDKISTINDGLMKIKLKK